jgi:hypothetical protein
MIRQFNNSKHGELTDVSKEYGKNVEVRKWIVREMKQNIAFRITG